MYEGKNDFSISDLTRLEFDRKKGKFVFRGSCLELLPLCEGFCCRVHPSIEVTSDEYESGLYEAYKFCLLNDKRCERGVETCINLNYRLKRKEDGSCIYQDSSNKCSIQEQKPRICRDFSCQGGWRLRAIFPVDGKGKITDTKMEKPDFVKRLTDDMTFVLHPLLKIHTLFYLKEKKEIIFVKEMVGGCGKFNTRDHFHNTKLDEDTLLGLIDLFGRKDMLKETRQRFCDQFPVDLEKNEFYEIIWLLNKHSIILESRNFSGMLGGIGLI